MVICVSHLTDQVEIAGGGHAPILSRARGPAPPPSAGPRAPNPSTNPTPSRASDSCTSIPLGGYDDPFLFHGMRGLVSAAQAARNAVPAKDPIGGGIAAKPAARDAAASTLPAASSAKRSPAFENLVRSLGQNAAMLLGGYADPRTGQPMLDLEGAREMIDMLDVLREKTQGNLAAEEDTLLLDVLGNLKLAFMEMAKAAAKQEKAQSRP